MILVNKKQNKMTPVQPTTNQVGWRPAEPKSADADSVQAQSTTRTGPEAGGCQPDNRNQQQRLVRFYPAGWLKTRFDLIKQGLL